MTDEPQDDLGTTPDPGPAVAAEVPLRRRYGAAVAGSLVPGLGHLLLGRRRLGLLFLAPAGLLLAGLAVLLLASGGVTGLAARAIDPGVLGWLIALQLAVLAWRLAAVGSSLTVARPPRYRRAEALPVVILVALVVAPQAYLVDVTAVARQAALDVFASSLETGGVWKPSPAPVASGATPSPTPSPTPVPDPLTQRTTVLLIGEDSGPDRRTALTDTMIIASLDPVAKTVSMLSIPRDLVDVPLPGGGVFSGKINSLAAVARRNPAAFPGSDGNGEGVLAAALGELVGVPIDHWAKVNLPGLFRLIDKVGGIDVTITRSFCDPQYRQYGQQSFGVKPGRWHLDGSQALAYARIRKPNGESDFTRAARQQDVLISLRDAVVKGGFLADPIGFIETIGATLSTSVPPSLVASLAQYATQIPRENVYRAVVVYPLLSNSSGDARGWVELPNLPRIRELGTQLFPAPGTLPIVPRVGTGVGYGFEPSASQTPKPDASASTGPTPTPAPVIPEGRAPDLPRITCKLAPATPSPSPSPTPSGSAASDGTGVTDGTVVEPTPSDPGTGLPTDPPPIDPAPTEAPPPPP